MLPFECFDVEISRCAQAMLDGPLSAQLPASYSVAAIRCERHRLPRDGIIRHCISKKGHAFAGEIEAIGESLFMPCAQFGGRHRHVHSFHYMPDNRRARLRLGAYRGHA